MMDWNNKKEHAGQPTPEEIAAMGHEEESRLVEAEFQDLLSGYLNSNHRKKVEIIERAFQFARKAHYGIRRRSGEPYILHPIAVAKIVSQEIGLGSTSICAALLHDVVEDTEYTVEDIESRFGPKIAQLVSGLTKISGGIFGDKASMQAENFRHLLLTMSEDIRVILIKMADRLHNMRTLGSMTPNKQYKIAGETLYIYAPLAHRLGLFPIKTELEDLSFKYEHPQAYADVERQVAETEARRNSVYADFAQPILERLDRMGLTYEAKARMKSVYSIWRKMETKHVPFSDVYDLYAMRIIFECDDPAREKEICMSIYSAITDLYDPHPDRFRDWVSVPKANGYQALHVTVMGKDGNWVEVQIRSRRMDEIAEKGFAAHWKYKIGESDNDESELNEWLQTIQDILEDPTPGDLDFFDKLKMNLFAQEIGVFTPKGELITLPLNATVLDVAYHIHGELGDHCIAGKVNHRLVPLSCQLQSGDQVEVLTSGKQTPKPEWMNIVVTARARVRLGAALRRLERPVLERGKGIVRDFFSANGVAEPTNEQIMKIMSFYHFKSPDDLYRALGDGRVSIDKFELRPARASIVKRLFRIATGRRSLPAPAEEPAREMPSRKIDPKAVYPLTASADGTCNFVLRGCCQPLPGDDVMGFINDDGRVELHELKCQHAQMLKAGYGPRVLSTRWEKVEMTFPVTISIEGIDRKGILQELTQCLTTTLDLDIRSLEIKADGEVFSALTTVKVPDTRRVAAVCSSIGGIEGIRSARRLATADSRKT
ncbi:MAG: RelA/SpoT family protein [Clostridium sp.]|nr:RelA/SpoT family protein [Clostridium sp.]